MVEAKSRFRLLSLVALLLVRTASSYGQAGPADPPPVPQTPPTDPAAPEAEQPSMAVLLRTAERHFKEGRYQQALGLYEQLVKLWPTSPPRARSIS